MAKRKKKEPKKCSPERAQAAADVLEAVWLRETEFELEHEVDAENVIEDEDGNPWVLVRVLVPQLDVDLWLDGDHPEQRLR